MLQVRLMEKQEKLMKRSNSLQQNYYIEHQSKEYSAKR